MNFSLSLTSNKKQQQKQQQKQVLMLHRNLKVCKPHNCFFYIPNFGHKYGNINFRSKCRKKQASSS